VIYEHLEVATGIGGFALVMILTHTKEAVTCGMH